MFHHVTTPTSTPVTCWTNQMAGRLFQFQKDYAFSCLVLLLLKNILEANTMLFFVIFFYQERIHFQE